MSDEREKPKKPIVVRLFHRLFDRFKKPKSILYDIYPREKPEEPVYGEYHFVFGQCIWIVVPSLVGVAFGRGYDELIEKNLRQVIAPHGYPNVFYWIAGTLNSSWWIFLIIGAYCFLAWGRAKECEAKGIVWFPEVLDWYLIAGFCCFWLCLEASSRW